MGKFKCQILIMVDSDVFIVASVSTWTNTKWKCTKRVTLQSILIAVMIATAIIALLTILNFLMLILAFKTLKYGKDYQNTGVLSSAGKVR